MDNNCSDKGGKGGKGPSCPKPPSEFDTFFAVGIPMEESPNGDGTAATEAPTGYDNLSNGYLPQGPDFNTINEGNVFETRNIDEGTFNDDRFLFEQIDTAATGLGPIYNAQGCRECHQNVVSGNSSQIPELRTVREASGVFFDSLAGSLVPARATFPDIVERVQPTDNVMTLRLSPGTIGDGFVECIANETLLKIRAAQPVAMRGVPIIVPVLETLRPGVIITTNNPMVAPNAFTLNPSNHIMRIGRFGWKCQHASLFSFSGDAYLNEVGITSPLFPDENLSDGRYVGFDTGYDPVPDPEDSGNDIAAFTGFMRSLKAPERGPKTAAVKAGEKLFTQIGCSTCHTPTITTAPPGTEINGGAFIVPSALGDKIIHPYSDFLGHDIGSSDGIPIQNTPQYAYTATNMRTAPLWGLRTRNRLFHDGLTFTLQHAIARHDGQATSVRAKYYALSPTGQTNVIAFLDSL